MEKIRRSKQDQVSWALLKDQGVEHVTFPNFVHKFGFTNSRSAVSAYSALLRETQINEERRKRLNEEFKDFQTNSAELFWSELDSKVDTILSSRKAGIMTRAVGLKQASYDFNRRFEDMENTEQSAPTYHNVEKPTGLNDDEESEQGFFDKTEEMSFSSISKHLEDASSSIPNRQTTPAILVHQSPLRENQRQSPQSSKAQSVPILAQKRKEHTQSEKAGTKTHSKNKKRGESTQPTVTDSAKKRRMERLERLDQTRFWKLTSGRCVERVLFEASMTINTTVKISSYTIDFDCPVTKDLFTRQEWTEISSRNRFNLPELPPSTLEYLLRLSQAAIAKQPVIQIPMPTEDRGSCELILDTFRTWCRLYNKAPSPFLIQDLSEAFWGRKAWPLLMELLDDQDNLFVIDGEKSGLESAIRKNQGRHLHLDTSASRKPTGRKMDLVIRDVLDKRDWMIVERMKTWDIHSSKFLKESGWDLFRETYTIMKHRLQDTRNRDFEEHARFFGIYTGDRGFKSFELRPSGAHSYVSLFKEYPVYDLPTSLTNMRPNIQGVVHLLQLRKCMIETINSYQSLVNSSCLENENSDMSWVYCSSHPHLDARTTLASSPISSPYISPEHHPLIIDGESVDEFSFSECVDTEADVGGHEV